MSALIDVTEQDIDKVFRGFALLVLPSGVEVIKGQINRVPEPASPDFVVFWPIRRTRIETNVDDYIDTKFTGSISGTTLSVTAIAFGTIQFPRLLFGVGVAANTLITGQLTGPAGGIGDYTVSVSQTLTPDQTLAAGVAELLQPTEVVYQVDVHGPNSPQNAQIISTTFRDDYACEQFRNLVAQHSVKGEIQPLFADDPKQIPFVNEANQYEFRWVIEANMQANITVSVPQEFADSVVVGLIEVDTTYPP